jgi:methionyl-tRNA synthetase
MKHFYITTAIDYANGSPHLGHAYEKILADVIARYQRLKGNDVYFLTGLDEHGQKVQQTAERKDMQPQALCDAIAEDFQAMCKQLEISNNDYIRTTEDRHKKVVSDILQKLYDQGDIYKAEYKGFYSTKEEQFLQEKDKIDGKWPDSYGEVSEISETNYFFKLSKHRDWLVKHIEDHPEFIFPAFRAKQVQEFLKEDIRDLCISRPKERLSWGIPLPFDANYVTYVWFDALINYLSTIGYGTETFNQYWPADCHVIGKDILIPAHAVYWPIMLKAMGVELPKKFLVHGWWLQSGAKMSKSKGNVVNPMDLIDQFGADPFRYFLIREMNVGQDSDFSMELFLVRYNTELGNDLGNLVSRLLNMSERYCDGKVPAVSIHEEAEGEVISLWESSGSEILKLFDTFQFHKALELLFTFIRSINRYAETRAPWKLAKSTDPEDRKKLDTSIAIMAEGVRLGSLILQPIMPQISAKIQHLLGLEVVETWDHQWQWGSSLEGKKLGEKCILFPRVEQEIT